jgi:hypothetical protein
VDRFDEHQQLTQEATLGITPIDPRRGIVQWVRLLGSSSSDNATALTTGSDGAIYMAGCTEGRLDGQTNRGFYDAFLLEI